MRNLREITVFAHALHAIDEEEFALLYDVTKPNCPMVPFWRYQSFDLDKMTDDECLAEFRFFRNDIYSLADILQLPVEMKCYNGIKVDKGLCIFLKRFAYPCRYVDMVYRFARPEPQLCMISNQVMNIIHERFAH